MRYTPFIAIAPMLVVCATADAEDCQPAFASGDQTLVINGGAIEPGGRATQDFQVQVQNEAGALPAPDDESAEEADTIRTGRCKATIRIARVGLIADSDFPFYSLRGPANQQVLILPDPASGGTAESDVFIANVPAAPQYWAAPFQIVVPTEWGVRAGTYIDQLKLLLIDQMGNVADHTTLTATISIPSAVSLRLVGAVVGAEGRGPARIDLGELSKFTETHSDQFGARIFSTAPYTVEFRSANLGHLQHEQGSKEIPYSLYFDGALVDLSATYEIPYLEHTPRSGDSRPMRIVVPPVVAPAGRYSDRITITVSAM